MRDSELVLIPNTEMDEVIALETTQVVEPDFAELLAELRIS